MIPSAVILFPPRKSLFGHAKVEATHAYRGIEDSSLFVTILSGRK